MTSPVSRYLRVIEGGDALAAPSAEGAALAAPAAAAAPAVATPVTLDGAFRAHAGFVARVALRVLGRPSEVDDLVQDVFLCVLVGSPGTELEFAL